MNAKAKKTLSTYVEPDLAKQVEEEAQRKRVSTSAVLRWAILDRYQQQTVELSQEAQSTVEPVRS